MVLSLLKIKQHLFGSEEDAILVGRITAEKDNPSLTVREVTGKNPTRIVIDKELKLSKKLNLFNNDANTIVFNALKTKEINSNYYIKIDFNNLIKSILQESYKQKIHSIIIEGGAKTLQSFIDKKLWDEARIFTANKTLDEGVKSPNIDGEIIIKEAVGGDVLAILFNA